MKYKYFGCRGNTAAFMEKHCISTEKICLHYGSREIIIPVPLHRRKQRIRGFNQAELLAKELSRYAGIPVDTAILKSAMLPDHRKNWMRLKERRIFKKLFRVVEILQECVSCLLMMIYTTGSTMDVLAKLLLEKGGIPCIFSHAVYWKQQVKKCFSWHGIYDTIILYEYSFSALKRNA